MSMSDTTETAVLNLFLRGTDPAYRAPQDYGARATNNHHRCHRITSRKTASRQHSGHAFAAR